MSVQATTWVWEQQRWKGNQLLILLAIADAANREGKGSCQGVRTIAAMAGCSRATAFDVLRALEQEGTLRRAGTHPTYGTVIWELPIGLAEPDEGCGNRTPEGGPETGRGPETGPGGVQKTDPGGSNPPDPTQVPTPAAEDVSASVTGPRASTEPVDNRLLQQQPRCDVCSLLEADCRARPLSGHTFVRAPERAPRPSRIQKDTASGGDPHITRLRRDLAPSVVGATADHGPDQHDTDKAGEASSVTPTQEDRP